MQRTSLPLFVILTACAGTGTPACALEEQCQREQAYDLVLLCTLQSGLCIWQLVGSNDAIDATVTPGGLTFAVKLFA